MAGGRKDERAAGTALRLRSAIERSSYGSFEAVAREVRRNVRQLHRWAHRTEAAALPPSAAVDLCAVLSVQLRWLLAGEDTYPPSLAWWLLTAEADRVPRDVRQWVADLPLEGYDPPAEFWSAAVRARRDGLCDEHDDAEIVVLVRHSIEAP